MLSWYKRGTKIVTSTVLDVCAHENIGVADFAAAKAMSIRTNSPETAARLLASI